MRCFRTVSCRESHLRIASDGFEAAVEALRRERRELEAYLVRHPDFQHSLVPVGLLPSAPEIARRMHRAAARVGVGPMAAVAGTIAQRVAEAALAAGAREAIVENGGDIYLAAVAPVTVALYAGLAGLGGELAFRVTPEQTPLAVCSSSSRMGHSLSFGDCDLATVVSTDASLADAAATRAGNLVRSVDDLQAACEAIAGIAGIAGVLLVKDDRVALAGRLPELVRNHDPQTRRKITRDPAGGPLPG